MVDDNFTDPPHTPTTGNEMFDWEILDEPPRQEPPSPQPAPRMRLPWGAIFAITLGTATLTAALGGAILWGAGVFDEDPAAVNPGPAYTLVSTTNPAPTTTPPAADTAPTTQLVTTPSQTADAALPVVGSDPDVTVAELAQRVIPSIVTVYNFSDQPNPFTNQPEPGPVSTGSGVIFNADGYLLTNDHVIDRADSLRVILHDGRSLPATLVGTDPLMDIAVLKVEASGLTPIELGDISQARIGDPTVAVGNPLGLDGGPSVTAGIISAFDRTLRGSQLYGLLQTDAPITSGSSGGALVNSDGHLLGITTLVGLSPGVGAEGLGFAVPVNLLTGIIDDLLTQGQVNHGYLGIQGGPAFVEEDNGTQRPIGVEIHDLLENSAVGAAGGEIGDVITALDNQPVSSMTLLVARLRGYRADDQLQVTVGRGDQTLQLDVTLGLFPQDVVDPIENPDN